jgi:hypothetical protein
MIIEKTIIAAKVSNDLRTRINIYLTSRDLNMSKFIRQAAEYLLDSDPIERTIQWGVRS